LLESFASNRKDKVIKTLEYLLDEGKVLKKDGKVVANTEKQV
jgi:hypothetical protein